MRQEEVAHTAWPWRAHTERAAGLDVQLRVSVCAVCAHLAYAHGHGVAGVVCECEWSGNVAWSRSA